MIFEIALVVVIFMNFALCWHEMSKQEKEVCDLSSKQSIANESIRDLKTRIRFLESEEYVLHSIKEKARDLETRIIFLEQKQYKYDEWIESHPPIKPI